MHAMNTLKMGWCPTRLAAAARHAVRGAIACAAAGRSTVHSITANARSQLAMKHLCSAPNDMPSVHPTVLSAASAGKGLPVVARTAAAPPTTATGAGEAPPAVQTDPSQQCSQPAIGLAGLPEHTNWTLLMSATEFMRNTATPGAQIVAGNATLTQLSCLTAAIYGPSSESSTPACTGIIAATPEAQRA